MDLPPETLRSGPVELRRWRTSDSEVLHRLISEAREHLLPWMPFAATHDRTQGERYLARCQGEWATGDTYAYAIVLDGVPVGSCSLMRGDEPGGLDIGYWLHPSGTGRGLATAAAAALVELGRGMPGVERIEIHHDEANTASGAVPRRLGFTEVGRAPFTGGPTAPGESGIDVTWRLETRLPAGS
ncbi:GNAT family N-acetyltransferase [Streptomyces sp. NPDC003327]